MVLRRGRVGARYFPSNAGNGAVDDVQFFSARTLSGLLRRVGFEPSAVSYSGFLPPRFYTRSLARVEDTLGRVPLLRALGYFYLVDARKRTDRVTA
jgi:hypothetical protein